MFGVQLVRRGLLGSAYGSVSLGCQVCRLGKQVKLRYPHSRIVSHRPFNLVRFDVWGSTPFALKKRTSLLYYLNR